MKTSYSLAGAVCLLAALTAIGAQEVPLQVSPQTLLLGAEQSSVTLHAAIPYLTGTTVEDVWIEVNGVTVGASGVFADSRGELVAKFPEDLVKGAVDPGTATIAFYYDRGTDVWSASSTVLVRKYTAPSMR